MNAPIDITNVILHTGRLTLRPFQQADLDDFYEYASVDGVGQMCGWKPHENKEITQSILNLFIEGKKTFAICYNGKVIGSIGIEENKIETDDLKELKGRELGFVLSKAYWGKGLMPEAVKEVIRYLFEEVHLDYIVCGYFVWNKQSKRVQEKCGFVPQCFFELKTSMGTTETTQQNILMYSKWKDKE